MKINTLLYWKLSGFYFCFFAVSGAIGPYWPLYLKSLSFDAAAIGELTAIYIGGSFFSPYLWAWIADHTDRSIGLIRLLSLLSVITFAGVLRSQAYWSLALLLFGFSFFLNGVFPQIEANTLSHIKNGNNHYGLVRLWGSFGFIITTLFLGKALERMTATLIPQIAFMCLTLTAVISFFLPQPNTMRNSQHEGDIKRVLIRPEVIAFMASAFMMFVGYSPYTVYFSIYLEEHGYERGTIGTLWALGMLSEISVFFLVSRLMISYSLKALLLFSYIMTTMRWLLIGFYVESFTILLLAQILQAASIGVYHTAAINLIHLLFRGKYQHRGQAIYVCLAGIASVVGILGCAYLWDKVPASACYSFAALSTVVAFMITWRHVKI